MQTRLNCCALRIALRFAHDIPKAAHPLPCKSVKTLEHFLHILISVQSETDAWPTGPLHPSIFLTSG